MNTVKVFVASSNDEIEERNAIKNILLSANDITHLYGVDVVPAMWELKSFGFKPGLARKQNEYNDELISSQLVVFIFNKRVGQYTHEEFEVACEQIKNMATLKMLVYFKNSDLQPQEKLNQSYVDGLQSIIELQNTIKELGQVYGEFSNTEELQIIVMKELLLTVIPVLLKQEQYASEIKELNKLYIDTDKPYQIEQRNKIIEDCMNSLYFLHRYNYTPKLDNESFYELCHQIISSSHTGDRIEAVSLMLKCEWDNSDDERNFWEDNENAVKRHVRLERIFVVSKDKAHRLKTNPQIKNHIDLGNKYNNIQSYIVEKEVLQRENPTLLEQAGDGFILINSQQDKIALLDETPGSGQRAKPITNTQELQEVTSIFHNIKKYSTPLKDYLDSIAWSHCKKEMISIFVTTKCNLNCDYCFTNKNNDGHKGQTISFDFVKKGIDDYFNNTDFMRHVRFFGAGEPTREFELLKRIHKYAKDKGGDIVTFEIQTNGAFSDSIAMWLRENVDIIWISCDGTPEIQDKHRPYLNEKRKTSAVIKKNIRILKKSEKQTFVGIRATITNENVMRQTEMIDYFRSLGITDIWVDPIFPSVGDETVENPEFDVMLFAKEFLEAAEYAHKLGVFYGSILTCNFNDSVNKHCRACLPVPHLTTDGYVSACDMALFGNDNNHMSDLIYGKWNKDTGEIQYFQNKISNLQNRTTENLQHCEMCPAKEHCGGYCLGEVLNETKDLYGQKRKTCKAIRFLDKNLKEELRKYSYTHP